MSRIAVLFCVLVCLSGGAVARTVGFQIASLPDGAGPPVEVGIWYPSQAPAQPTQVELFTQTLAQDAPVDGHALPLVVISHGSGGSFASHGDTAFALARAGFVVAAPTHTGDNWRDQSRATDVAGRVRQLSAVIEYMVSAWPAHAVDPSRIGAFGFSAGGFTVLAAAGGKPDLGRIAKHCADHPAFFDCQLLRAHPPVPAIPGAAPVAFARDPRIRALVVAAPALGFTFDAAGLARVTMPVQLWRAEDDAVLPEPFYAEAVRRALPHAPEMHAVPHAGHFDFLAPCPAALARIAPPICAREPGFDRAAFHESFNSEVVGFFQRTMGRPN